MELYFSKLEISLPERNNKGDIEVETGVLFVPESWFGTTWL